MDLNVNNILGKLDNENLARIIGFIMTEQAAGVAHGGDFMSFIMAQINGLTRNPHVPDLRKVWWSLTQGTESNLFKNGITAAVAGWILKEAGINPSLNKFGGLAQTWGTGIAIGATASTALTYSSIYSELSQEARQLIGGSSSSNSSNPFEGVYGR